MTTDSGLLDGQLSVNDIVFPEGFEVDVTVVLREWIWLKREKSFIDALKGVDTTDKLVALVKEYQKEGLEAPKVISTKIASIDDRTVQIAKLRSYGDRSLLGAIGKMTGDRVMYEAFRGNGEWMVGASQLELMSFAQTLMGYGKHLTVPMTKDFTEIPEVNDLSLLTDALSKSTVGVDVLLTQRTLGKHLTAYNFGWVWNGADGIMGSYDGKTVTVNLSTGIVEGDIDGFLDSWNSVDKDHRRRYVEISASTSRWADFFSMYWDMSGCGGNRKEWTYVLHSEYQKLLHIDWIKMKARLDKWMIGCPTSLTKEPFAQWDTLAVHLQSVADESFPTELSVRLDILREKLVKQAAPVVDPDLVKAVKAAVGARNEGKTCRNKGPREVLTKGEGSMMYSFAPSSIGCAAKFGAMFSNCADKFRGPGLVVGVANNNFWGVLDALGLTQGKEWYDISPKPGIIHPGVNVIGKSFWDVVPTGSGVLIDDSTAVHDSAFCSRVYKPGDIRAKVDFALRGNYDAICLKGFLHQDTVCSFDWLERVFARYDKVSLVRSGKVQSCEYFLLAHTRLSEMRAMSDQYRDGIAAGASKFFRSMAVVVSYTNRIMSAHALGIVRGILCSKEIGDKCFSHTFKGKVPDTLSGVWGALGCRMVDNPLGDEAKGFWYVPGKSVIVRFAQVDASTVVEFDGGPTFGF